MRISLLALTFAIVGAASANAQTCPPTSPAMNANPYFEFQVETAARFIPAGGELPFPDISLNERPPYTKIFALVQFIVDTGGVPIAKSLQILVHPEGLVADSVTAAILRWHFQPAKVAGCHVQQLVQSALRWR